MTAIDQERTEVGGAQIAQDCWFPRIVFPLYRPAFHCVANTVPRWHELGRSSIGRAIARALPRSGALPRPTRSRCRELHA